MPHFSKPTPSSIVKKYMLFFVFFCSQLVLFGQDLSKDKAMGEKGLTQVKEQIGIYPFEALDTVLQQLGQRLVNKLEKPLFNYEFYLVDMPEPNAFALPGGKIFVTRGLLLLPLTEDELAGVIGHEIIHANNRHSVKQQRNGVFGALIAIPGIIIGSVVPGDVGQAIASPFLLTNALITSSYSRGHESEADREGVALAAKTGYQPLELASILERLNNESEFLTGEEEQKSYLSSHPYTPKRVKSIQKEAEKLQVSQQKHLVDSTSFLLLFNDLLASDNPAHGYKTKENVFYQPTYLYSIQLSDAWETATSPQILSIRDTADKAVAMIGVQKDSLSYKEYLEKFEEGMLKQAGAKPTKRDKFSWFGHKGGMLEFEQNNQNGQLKMQVFTVAYAEGELLKMLTVFEADAEKKVNTLLKSTKSIQKEALPPAEVSTLFIVKALENESLEELISRENAVDFTEHIAVINGKSLAHIFKKGDLVKVLKHDFIHF